VGKAVLAALDHAGADDAVLVTGSLYTVGAARRAARSIPGLTVV
jgi:folylpolyglutamate synthase/dihydropteroate synthase